MRIDVSARHMELTDAINEYAESKADRLTKYFDRIQLIEIVLDQQDREFEVEMRVHVEHHDDFVGKAKGEDVYSCIDAVLDKLVRQISDHKDRLKDHKPH
ncbi:MAG TPA: ribosome-associated translation inhibitor RaiA [Phycisphaeraceae bacterium]|nr:ribosome-associated translation inhibitor RaiA [Phycisphaeraceae bacterium]